jgi:hypothetical protein
MSTDPTIKARYLLDRETPVEIREELERRLGARDGDSIALWSEGVVTLVRMASDDDARAVLPTLRPERARGPRRSGDHLWLVESRRVSAPSRSRWCR